MGLLSGDFLIVVAIGLIVLLFEDRWGARHWSEGEILEAVHPIAWREANRGANWIDEYHALDRRFRRVWARRRFAELGNEERAR